MLTRRQLLGAGGLGLLAGAAGRPARRLELQPQGPLVNDVHSRISQTRVAFFHWIQAASIILFARFHRQRAARP